MEEVRPQLSWSEDEICVTWIGHAQQLTLLVDLSSGSISWASVGQDDSGQDDCATLPQAFLDALAAVRGAL